MPVLPGARELHRHRGCARLRYLFARAAAPGPIVDDKPAFMAHGGDIPAIFDGVRPLPRPGRRPDRRRRRWPSRATRCGPSSAPGRTISWATSARSTSPPRLARAARRVRHAAVGVGLGPSDTPCGRRTRDADEVLARVSALLAISRTRSCGVRPTAPYGTNMMGDELGSGLRDLCAKHDSALLAAHIGALAGIETEAMRAWSTSRIALPPVHAHPHRAAIAQATGSRGVHRRRTKSPQRRAARLGLRVSVRRTARLWRHLRPPSTTAGPT